MNRIGKYIATFFVISTITLLIYGISAAAAGSGIVTGSLVNIRNKPSTDSKVLAQTVKNEKVELISKDENWFRILYKGTEGYISADFIEVTSPIEKIGYASIDALNVRASDTTESDVLTVIKKGEKVTIVNEKENWYEITYNDGTAYVYKQYITVDGETEYKKGIIKAEVLNLRNGPNGDIIGKLASNIVVDILEEQDGWFNIDYDGTIGFVSVEYVTVDEDGSLVKALLESRKKDSDISNVGDDNIPYNKAMGDKIVAKAKEFLGVNYVYGGTSPKGFDCSGLTYYVFKQFGITIERRASLQAKNGKTIKYSELKPGDLVFFRANGYAIGHVGLYVGNGNFIHAPQTGEKVKIETMATGRHRDRFVTAKRMF